MISLRPIADSPTSQPRFHAVPIAKLVILSVTTMGFYQIYWFYKNWKLVEVRSTEDITPWARALFAVFFVHSLFTRVRDDGYLAKVPGELPAGALALLYIAMVLCSRLPDPYWLISLGAFAPLIPVQLKANEINRTAAPDAPRNDTWSYKELLVTALGGLLLIAALLGTFFPDQNSGEEFKPSPRATTRVAPTQAVFIPAAPSRTRA